MLLFLFYLQEYLFNCLHSINCLNIAYYFIIYTLEVDDTVVDDVDDPGHDDKGGEGDNAGDHNVENDGVGNDLGDGDDYDNGSHADFTHSTGETSLCLPEYTKNKQTNKNK